MEDSKLNLKPMISILVGVVALVMIIPVVSNIMNHEPKKTYIELKLNHDDYYYIGRTSPSAPILDFGLSYDYDAYEWLNKPRSILINFEDDYTNVILPYSHITVNISNVDSSLYGLSYDITAYGLYDFTQITIVEENQILNPIITLY